MHKAVVHKTFIEDKTFYRENESINAMGEGIMMTLVLAILILSFLCPPMIPATETEVDSKQSLQTVQWQKVIPKLREHLSEKAQKFFKQNQKQNGKEGERSKEKFPADLNTPIVMNLEWNELASQQILDKFPIRIAKPNPDKNYTMLYAQPQGNGTIRERKAIPEGMTIAPETLQKMFPGKLPKKAETK